MIFSARAKPAPETHRLMISAIKISCAARSWQTKYFPIKLQALLGVLGFFRMKDDAFEPFYQSRRIGLHAVAQRDPAKTL